MKKVIALILALCMVFALCACGKPATPDPVESSAPENEPYHIGYLAPGLSSEFNMMVNDGLTALAKEEGVKLDVLSCEGDVAKQIEQIDTFITMGVDCIIAFPVDPGSCTDALVKARDAGIKIVTTDINVGREAYDLAYNYSEEALGTACAKAAAEWIDANYPDAEKGSVEVAIIGAGFSEQALSRGEYQSRVTEYTDKAKLVEVYNVGLENFASLSEQYTQVILQNYPDIACIISYTDTLALIADEIIMHSGKDVSKFAQFTVDLSKNGYDAIAASKENGSTIRGTCGFPDVCQFLFDMAMDRVEVDADGVCFLDPSSITVENLDDYSYLYY